MSAISDELAENNFINNSDVLLFLRQTRRCFLVSELLVRDVSKVHVLFYAVPMIKLYSSCLWL